MERKIDYGVRIEIGNNSFRIGTDRLVTDERGVKAAYLPYLMSFTPAEASLSFEGEASVPSYNAEVWDGQKDIYTVLKGEIFEKARVYILTFEDKVLKTEDRGYIADLGMRNSNLSLTIRMAEDSASQDILKIFKHNSFQYMEAIVPFDVKFESSWVSYPNLPWKVYQIENHKAKLRFPYIQHHNLNVSPVDVGDKIEVIVDDSIFDIYSITTSNVNPYDTSAEGDTTVGGPDAIVNEFVLRASSLISFANFWDGSGASHPHYSSYAKIHLGDSTNLAEGYAPGTLINAIAGVCEVIEYSYFGEGYIRNDTGAWQSTPGRWWFSGIPTYATFTIPPVFAYDVRDPLGAGIANRMDIKFKHRANEVVAQADDFVNRLGLDVIWMSANGFVPDENDPEFGAGYIWLGKTRKHPIYGKDEKVLSRYKITDVYYNVYDEILDDGSTTNLLRMEIHNRPLDPLHEYAVFDIPLSRAEVPDSIDPDFVPEMYQHEFMVSSMDIWVPNISNAIYEFIDTDSLPFNPSISRYLRDRWSGIRIDQIRDFSELLQTVGRSNGSIADPSEYGQENINLINNATGKFAVCSASELRFDRDHSPVRFYERLYFHVPYEFGSYSLVDDPSTEGVAGTNQQYLAPQPKRDKVYMNYLTYKYGKNSATDYENVGSLMSAEARDYYMKSRYRAILDPVPENSEDIGKYFPIAYGYLKRVPVLQVISKKTMGESNETAGDDVYVYAQHPCDVALPSDLRIEFFEEGDNSKIKTPDQDLERQRAGLSQHLIKSPFPDYVDGHYRLPEGSQTPSFVNRLVSPYHALKPLKTLDGVPVQAFKLQGGEWDYRLGGFDKRYPIRNGLGNQTLYATFSGWVDATGEITGSAGAVVKHPVDIIHHFVRTYGKYPYSGDMFDLANLEYIKSRTPKYEASVFLNDQVNTYDLINDICQQFGIYWTLYKGKIRFYLGELEEIDYSKPIVDGLNIIGSIEEKLVNYNEINSRVIYNFKKNWHTDSFDGVIDLNYTNNAYCSNASKAFANKKEITVDAPFVNLYLVAKKVAIKYAKYYCTRKASYAIEVRRTEGIDFAPGDVVPLKYSPLGIDYAPVLIQSVKDNLDTTELTVLYFPELTVQTPV